MDTPCAEKAMDVKFEPLSVKLESPTVKLEPLDDLEPSSAKLEPSAVKSEPPSVKLETGAGKLEPSTVKLEPSIIKLEPSVVKQEPSSVKLESGPVKLEPLTEELESSSIKPESSVVKFEPSTVKPELSTVKLEPSVKHEPSAVKIEASTMKFEPAIPKVKYSGPKAEGPYPYNYHGDHVSNALAILRNRAMKMIEFPRQFKHPLKKAKILMNRCDYVESLRWDRRNSAVIAHELNRNTRHVGVFFSPELEVSPSFWLASYKGRDALFGLVGRKVSFVRKPDRPTRMDC